MQKKGHYYRSYILFHGKTTDGIASLKSNWEGDSVLKFRCRFKNRCNYFLFTQQIFTKQLLFQRANKM